MSDIRTVFMADGLEHSTAGSAARTLSCKLGRSLGGWTTYDVTTFDDAAAGKQVLLVVEFPINDRVEALSDVGGLV